MENNRSINEMNADEVKALLREHAPRGKMLDGDVVERIVFPAQQRLKALGMGADETLTGVQID